MRVVPARPAWADALTTIGVTGTNGKTSTAAFTAAALSAWRPPVVRITTVGAFLDDVAIGQPRSYEECLAVMAACRDAGGSLVVAEMTSEALARGFAKTWPSDVAVFTNLTHDHLDAHASAEHYLASKAQLFMHLRPHGCAVLNGCDSAAALLREVLPATARVVTYGIRARGDACLPLDLEGLDVREDWSGTTLLARGPDGEFTLRTRAIGQIFAENALAALCAAEAAGVPRALAIEAIANAAPPVGRFEVVSEEPRVVIDYAHTPDALARTLAAARRLCDGRLTVVFGAGGNRDRDKRPLMGTAAAAADRIILTSDNPRSEPAVDIAAAICRGIPANSDVHVELDRAAAIEFAIRSSCIGDVIVIAGKGHETTQTVGTDTLAFSDHEVAGKCLVAEPARPRSHET